MLTYNLIAFQIIKDSKGLLMLWHESFKLLYKENMGIFIQAGHSSPCPELSNREDEMLSMMIHRATLLTSLERISSMRNLKIHMEFL